MSRQSIVGLLVFVLIVGEARSISIRATPDVDFPNGGFETLPAGGPNDWTWPNSGWVWDGSIAHSGSHSARISRSFGPETASVYSADIVVQPTTTYTLTYWLRTQNATWYPSVSIYQYTAGGVQTGPRLLSYSNIGSGTNPWMLTAYRFQTMPNAAKINLRLFLWTDTTGTFWFDDFGLDQGPPARYSFHAGFPVTAPGGGYYSSPAVADIDGNGRNEVLAVGDSAVYGWNETGAGIPGFPLTTGDKLILGPIALADLDQDGKLEIAAGTRASVANGQGGVFVWRSTGALLNGWPQRVAWNTQYSNNASWVSSIALADIDGNGDLEVVAGTTNNASGNPNLGIPVPNLYAWHSNGTLVTGNWPNWYTAAGIYSALAVGDLTGGGSANVIVGRDFLNLYAYRSDGSFLSGWPIETYQNSNGGNYYTDNRLEYSDVGAPILADLDGDGQTEVIVCGNLVSPGNRGVVFNSGLLVLGPDGTRRHGWETAALGSGILAHVDLLRQAPAVADLDDDGQLEIVIATHDGWIRAYKADRTVLWAVNFTRGATLFASEPAIGDIDGDKALEIVFGTYVLSLQPSEMDGPVGLWALEANGAVLPGFPLVVPTPGVRAAPTLADLDHDGKLEILAATTEGQIIVWDTLAPYAPVRIPWPTTRHDLRRTATYVSPGPSLSGSRKYAMRPVAQQGEMARFMVHVVSNLPLTYPIRLTDTVPAGLAYVPATLTATLGTVTDTAGSLQWSGILSNILSADVKYDVVVVTSATRLISNVVVIDGGAYSVVTRTGYLFANGFSVFLPIVLKSAGVN